MRQSHYEKAELNTHSLKSLKLISRSLFYYTLASLHFLLSSCYLQQRKLTFNLGRLAALTHERESGGEGEKLWSVHQYLIHRSPVHTKESTIISACFITFLWPPQLPQPQVNQQHLRQHLRQQANDAFHIQHTANTTFSLLPPPLIYISILFRPSLFISTPPPSLLLSPLPSTSKSSDSPAPLHLLSRLSLSRCVCFPTACSSGVFKQKMKVLPEGTDAGLKGANSSVGGCRPCEGSRVLAGEAGVCGGYDWRSHWGKTKEKHIIENTVRIL